MKICNDCKNKNPENVVKCLYCGSKNLGNELKPSTINTVSNYYDPVVEIIEYAKKATAYIIVGGRPAGTGFFMSYNNKNYLVTNFHVVEAMATMDLPGSYFLAKEVDSEQDKFPIELLAVDQVNDIAICEFNCFEKVNILELETDKSTIKQGQEVINVGNPRDHVFSFSALVGRITNTSIGRHDDNAMNKILINLSATHGNSGGAIVSVPDKKVIGISSSIFKILTYENPETGEVSIEEYLPNHTLCVSSKAIKYLLDRYEKDGGR